MPVSLSGGSARSTTNQIRISFAYPRMLGFFAMLLLVAIISSAFASPTQALVNQTISFQGKIVGKTTGLNLMAGSPACVKAGADTCDFQVRVWNHITNSVTTSGSGNLLFTQAFQDVEIGDTNGIFKLNLNSCGSTLSGASHWGTTVGTCVATDDSDADSDPGINFNRADLYVEISFADTDTVGTLGTFSEAFTRKEIQSVPTAFHAQTVDNLSGLTAGNFVQLAPGAAQVTGNTTNTLININENGSGTPDLMDLLVGGTSVFNIDNAGHTGIGLAATSTSWLTIAAATTGASQINLASSVGTDPAAPASGDLWWNGTNLNFYDGSTTADLLAGGVTGFVKLQPTSVQVAPAADTLIWLNETNGGTPNLLDLQVGGTSRLLLNNAGQLQLPATGLTGGLLIGGDTNLYRSAATTLRTDNNFTVGDAITDIFAVLGVSDFTGNLRGVVTIADGSTTTTAAGSSITALPVTSTANFNVGNLVLLDGTTYARIDSIDSTTQMTVSPAVSWTNGGSVVEYTLPTVGSSTNIAQRFDKGLFVNGTQAGGTTFQDKQITSTGGLEIITAGTTGNISLSSQSNINLSTSGGVIITKNDQDNGAGSWSVGKPGGVARGHGVSAVHNNKWYLYGGAVSGGTTVNTMDVYDFTTQEWSSGVTGGTARVTATASIYDNKMYVWGGCLSIACTTFSNTVDIYDFVTQTWSTGTSGGTGRAGHVSVQHEGKIYYWSGCNGSGCSIVIDTMDIYDIATDSWSTGLAGGTGRASGVAVLHSGKMYAWAGLNASFAFTNAVDIYDIDTNTWSTGTTGGTSRYWSNAVSFGNKMYAWGGQQAAPLNSLDIYDFGTDTWSVGTAGGINRNRYHIAVQGELMYAWGGNNSASNTTGFIDTMDIYNFGQRDTVLSIRSGADENIRLDTNNVLNVQGRPLGLKYVTNDSDQYTKVNWTVGTTGGTARIYSGKGVESEGKMYYWGGCTTNACAGILNTMDIYDIATRTWSTGATGGTARWFPTAEVSNGKIYYIMGCTSANSTCTTVSNVVDIYDIATDTWSTGTTGGTARGAAGSGLYNGNIYIWGGRTAVANINTLDIYNISGDSWSTGTAGGVAKRNMTGAVVGDNIYFWGGFTTAAVNTIYVYNITGDSWTTATAGGTARYHTTPIVHNNRIYYWGGQTTVAVNTMDIYDIATDRWIVGTSTGGTTRYGQYVAISGSEMYIWGGFNGTAAVNTMDIYDFDAAHIWTARGAGGTPRTGHVAEVYQDKMYILGGCVSACVTTPVTTNTVDIYDFKTRTWSTGTPGSTSRQQMTSALYNGKIYVYGGCLIGFCDAADTLDIMEIYDIATDSWSTGTSGNKRAMAGSNSVVNNGKIYYVTGTNGTATINTVDIYDIITDSWSSGTAGGVARNRNSVVQYKNKIYSWAGTGPTGLFILTMDVYDIQTDTWSVGVAGGDNHSFYKAVVYQGKMYAWGGQGQATFNLMNVYDFDRNVWIDGVAGGAEKVNHTAVVYEGKMYTWGGLSANVSVLLSNTLDVYDFGASGSEEVFYIANAQGVGPDDGKLFRFDATGRAYTSKQGGWFSVGADYAEYMFTKDPTLSPGELVTLDTTVKGGIKRVTKKQDESVIGVISTEPGFVGNIKDINNLVNNDPNWKLLSMVGQVIVKVSTENGDIKAGDIITSSSVPGVGMRGNPGDPHVGVAQEDYINADVSAVGAIEVLVTRNNRGVNNLPEIKLSTTNNEETLNAGIRINTEGALEYRNSNSEWKSLEERITTDSSMLWIKEGDFMKTRDKTVIGQVAGEKTSQLTVANSIGIKGLVNLDLNADAAEVRIGNSAIRFNSQTNEIEYKEGSSTEWVKFSSVVRGEPNQRIESGWGYVQGDVSLLLVSKPVAFKTIFTTSPRVSITYTGVSTIVPTSLAGCTESDVEAFVSSSNATKSQFNANLASEIPLTGKYYCYSWLAVGN